MLAGGCLLRLVSGWHDNGLRGRLHRQNLVGISRDQAGRKRHGGGNDEKIAHDPMTTHTEPTPA
jgi:hypothetical protein